MLSEGSFKRLEIGRHLGSLFTERGRIVSSLTDDLIDMPSRELLFFGTEEQSTVRDSKEQIKGLKLLSRTYRILSMGQPLMVIEEKFPVDGPR